MRALTVGLVAGALAAFASVASAEEGMWTFDNVPRAKMQAEIGMAPDQAWLDRVRLGSGNLRGCSSAIVSAEGLVQTNHHCVVGCLQRFSTPENDTVRNGFRAMSRAEERQCQGMSLAVLQQALDKTAEIKAATAGKTGGAFTQARDGKIAEIERACKGDAKDVTCRVISLYQGGRYTLHRYKDYNDVRMVFAPEYAAGFFGGDPDNFNFPRYAFDVAYLRVYENGQPAATPNRLVWRSEPLKDGEPVFVSGNPGATSRLLTTDQLAFQRDVVLPYRLALLGEQRGRLIQFSKASAENARVAADRIFGIENSFKALTGRRAALVDPNAFGMIQKKEDELQAAIQRNRRLRADVGDAYGEIARAVATERQFFLPAQFVEYNFGNGSALLGYARTLVRGAAEREKPDSQRLTAFTDARRQTLEQGLFAARPISADLEEVLISFWAEKMREYLTADDPLVAKALGKESPEQLAKRIATASTLSDPAVRKALWEGGRAAVETSTDPAIVLARALEADARALRSRFDAEVQAPTTAAQQRIAAARFAIYGEGQYPDATGSLRLSYGRVIGWTEPSGREVPSFTRTEGLWRRATGNAPFVLADSWASARDKLDPQTIFNVSSTNDIIGGNSGSPLLDAQGRVVGAVFDGNIHSLGGEYVYDITLNRAVTVASTIVEEALVDVYGMGHIVEELKR